MGPYPSIYESQIDRYVCSVDLTVECNRAVTAKYTVVLKTENVTMHSNYDNRVVL
mgnify:CR=1 FL=1